MTKTKKILLIVGLSLLALLVICGLVFWLLYPELVVQWANVAWDWLNAPLPIVGVVYSSLEQKMEHSLTLKLSQYLHIVQH